MSDRRAGCFRVSYGLLAELLHLPPVYQIRRVTSEIAGLDDCLIIVEGPDLPLVEQGGMIPQRTPLFAKLADGTIRFEGWRAA